MMAHKKHLSELLQEDQEPFLLQSYIADRQCQLKRPIVAKTTTLQVKKRKPIVVESSSTSRRNLCKQACFFSFHDSPDVRKSPFVDFPSPAKSPSKSPNGISLRIPAKTTALLLEAAMRIQKQSSSSSKPKKTQIKNGLFGSILKRLGNRSRTRNREIGGDEVRVSMEDSFVGGRKSMKKSEKLKESFVGGNENSVNLVGNENGVSEMGLSCFSNHSRRNSTVWSESNEEKSLELETSSSCRSVDFEERENGVFDSFENQFSSSPLSPFRFALQKSPSSGRRTPDFSSPAASPSRHDKEEKENHEEESIKKIQLAEEEEEEKEQCSPVSVLDPPFEDDDEVHEDGDEEDDDYDLECSYSIVQKAKEQLLHKLRRFEKLAELDPIELEKRMLEEQDDEDDYEDLEDEEEDECEEHESPSLSKKRNIDGFVREVISKSSPHISKVSADIKTLVSDLIDEEKREQSYFNESEIVVKRVCKRLDSWKEVESNTIDMMVEFDFKSELYGWMNSKEQVRETATEIELAIFGLLLEELSEELVCVAGLEAQI